MKHSLFVSNIGVLNIQTGQAQKRLAELNIRINSGLGAIYKPVSVEDLLKDGLKVDGNGNITEAALNEYFQGLSERNKDYVAVKLTIGERELRSCYGPESFDSSPVAKSIPPAPVKPLPKLSAPAPKFRNAERTCAPAPAQSSEVTFMRPGQLKAEFDTQQQFLKKGTPEETRGVSNYEQMKTTLPSATDSAASVPSVAAGVESSTVPSEPAWKVIYRGLSWFGKLRFWQEHPLPGLENMVRSYKGLPPIGS